MPKGFDGQVLDEQPRGRGFVDLGSFTPEGERETEGPEVEGILDNQNGETPASELSYAPTTPLESQPEQEEFPQDPSNPSENDISGEPPQENSIGEMVDVNDGRHVPVPGDDDTWFGDDLEVSTDVLGVWEITVKEHDMEPSTAELLCQKPAVFDEVFVASGEACRSRL